MQLSINSLEQRWPNYDLQTSLIRPAKYLAHFASTTFPNVDSSVTAFVAAFKWNANKIVWCCCYYCTTIHFNNLFCIDYVNSTVSGPPMARQSQIRPSGPNIWPPLSLNHALQVISAIEGISRWKTSCGSKTRAPEITGTARELICLKTNAEHIEPRSSSDLCFHSGQRVKPPLKSLPPFFLEKPRRQLLSFRPCATDARRSRLRQMRRFCFAWDLRASVRLRPQRLFVRKRLSVACAIKIVRWLSSEKVDRIRTQTRAAQ